MHFQRKNDKGEVMTQTAETEPKHQLWIPPSPWKFSDLMFCFGSMKACRDTAADYQEQARRYALQGPGRDARGFPLRNVEISIKRAF
jgi:hypothetical protein